MVETDEGVHFGHDAGKFAGESLRQATGDDDFLALAIRVAAASVHGTEDGVDGFLLGHVDERAGVDDEDIGEFRIGRERHAGLREVADHDFGVDQVFGAAE